MTTPNDPTGPACALRCSHAIAFEDYRRRQHDVEITLVRLLHVIADVADHPDLVRETALNVIDVITASHNAMAAIMDAAARVWREDKGGRVQ